MLPLSLRRRPPTTAEAFARPVRVEAPVLFWLAMQVIASQADQDLDVEPGPERNGTPEGLAVELFKLVDFELHRQVPDADLRHAWDVLSGRRPPTGTGELPIQLRVKLRSGGPNGLLLILPFLAALLFAAGGLLHTWVFIVQGCGVCLQTWSAWLARAGRRELAIPVLYIATVLILAPVVGAVVRLGMAR